MPHFNPGPGKSNGTYTGPPPTTEPLSRNSLDETIVSIRADEKEREKEQKEQQARGRTPRPETCYGPSSNIPLRPRGNCRSQASSADPNRFALNRVSVIYIISCWTRLTMLCMFFRLRL